MLCEQTVNCIIYKPSINKQYISKTFPHNLSLKTKTKNKLNMSNILLNLNRGNKMEPTNYVELKFPKKHLKEILRKKDKEALFKLVLESLENYMKENI